MYVCMDFCTLYAEAMGEAHLQDSQSKPSIFYHVIQNPEQQQQLRLMLPIVKKVEKKTVSAWVQTFLHCRTD